MYGLVNKAIEDLVSSRYGVPVWERIKQAAGVSVEGFVSMDPYPDEITYKLVGAASEVLQVPACDLLEAFGEFWVTYTAREGYGPMLQAAGSNFREFVLNLNNLHARVSMIAPKLRPPSFHCTDVTDSSLQLHYYSTRAGLAPMVVGLIRGLGKTFSTKVEIAHRRMTDASGVEHDVFDVQYSPV